MKPARPVDDMTALKQDEERCRKRLQEEPGDLGTRTALAWCLFSRALIEAGQQELLANLSRTRRGESPVPAGGSRALLDGPARDVLKESLRQTLTVLQLSRTPADHEEAERLQRLIGLSAGEETVREAEAELSRMLAELAQAILRREDGRPQRKGSRRRSPGV
jgi:hypothetical protein